MRGVKLRRSVSLLVLFSAFTLGGASVYAQAQTPFPDAHEPPTANWTGPVFKLSQDYPAAKPPAEPLPWTAIDFKTKPAEYLNAVRKYCYEPLCGADKFVCVALPGGTAANKLGQTYRNVVDTITTELKKYDDKNLTEWDFSPVAPLVRCGP